MRRAKNKRPTKPFILGRADFMRISAIEGIEPTPALDAEFRSFERQGLSHEKRRQLIRTRYGAISRPR